jgi:hypothetical protein
MILVPTRSWRDAGAAFATYLVLAVLATYPLVLRAGSFVCGVPTPPGEATPPLNIWAMATVLQHLPFDPLHLFEGTAFYPYAHTLAFSEHLFVPALLGAPVALASGNLVLAYNAVTLLTLALAGLGMFLLARETSGDPLAAFVAGVLYAFHTWNMNELVRLQILSNEFFPFLLLALVRFFARPGASRAALVGLAYALQSLSCMYWGLYLPFLVGFASLYLWWQRRVPARALLQLTLGVLPAVLLFGLFAIPYVATAREQGFVRPAPPSVAIDRYLDVQPGNYLYASLLGSARRDQNAAHFLGFLAIVLGAIGFASRRRLGGQAAELAPFFAAMGVAGFVLSLGPEIIWHGEALGPGPYALLRRFVPGFRNVRYPERLSVFVVLGLAPLVALGLAQLRPRLGRLGLALAAGLVLLEHLAIPQSLSYLPSGAGIPSAYRWLAAREDISVVAEVPASRIWMERADGLPMYLSTVHHKRTVQGYTSYFARSYNFIKWRLFHFPDPDSVSFLERLGVDGIVVSPGPDGPPAWAGEDPRWERHGPFPEGQVVLRLKNAAGQRYAPPPDDDALYAEIPRQGWRVQASRGDARSAIDSDPTTRWTTGDQATQGDFYRIRLPTTARLARVAMDLRPPICFPTHLKLLAGREGENAEEISFDEHATYERLFETLLHRPRQARMVIDFEPRSLDTLRLRITETDAFWMPWDISELHLYELKR